MYKKIFLFILVLFFTSFVFAQETEINKESISSEENVQEEDIVSTTEEFIEATSPSLAIVSVAKENKYGHPNNDVLKRLQKFR